MVSNGETFARKLHHCFEYACAEQRDDDSVRVPWEQLEDVTRVRYLLVAVGLLSWLREQMATRVAAQAENCYSDDLGDAARAAYADAASIIRKMSLHK